MLTCIYLNYYFIYPTVPNGIVQLRYIVHSDKVIARYRKPEGDGSEIGGITDSSQG